MYEEVMGDFITHLVGTDDASVVAVVVSSGISSVRALLPDFSVESCWLHLLNDCMTPATHRQIFWSQPPMSHTNKMIKVTMGRKRRIMAMAASFLPNSPLEGPLGYSKAVTLSAFDDIF